MKPGREAGSWHLKTPMTQAVQGAESHDRAPHTKRKATSANALHLLKPRDSPFRSPPQDLQNETNYPLAQSAWEDTDIVSHHAK